MGNAVIRSFCRKALFSTMTPSHQAFDHHAAEYDRWYDSDRGRAIFRQELACLRHACPSFSGDWLEVGMGSGRFAAKLGISCGLEPSVAMGALAARRGLKVFAGQAESMPFAAASFDGVMLVFTLCFLSSPEAALLECHRVLRPGGSLLLGIIPAGSAWGISAANKAAAGHPLYAFATFYSVAETKRLVTKTGFVQQQTASALLQPPQSNLPEDAQPIPGAQEKAGFVAMNWQKPPA